MKAKDLKPAPYNPRKVSDKKLSILEKTLKEYGDLSGIVFNIQTGNVVGGHQRLKVIPKDADIKKEPFTDKQGTVAKGFLVTSLGEFTYREVDWSLEKEKAANIAANKGAGEWDYTELKGIFESLDDGQFDFELTGFSIKEVEIQLNDSFLDKDIKKDKKSKEPSITVTNCPKCNHEIHVLSK